MDFDLELCINHNDGYCAVVLSSNETLNGKAGEPIVAQKSSLNIYCVQKLYWIFLQIVFNFNFIQINRL